MGVSGPAAAVILVAALLAQGGTLITAHRNAEAKQDHAREAWQRRHEAILAHALAIEDAAYNATLSRLTLQVNNTGLVALNASRVEVLLDGLSSTANVTQRTVAGAATSVWAPGEVLELRVTVAPKPADAAVVSPWGLLAARRGI